jgi:hypothetical protein
MLSTATTTLTLLLAVAMASAAPLDAEHQLLLPREQNPAGFNILGYLPNIPLNAIGAGVCSRRAQWCIPDHRHSCVRDASSCANLATLQMAGPLYVGDDDRYIL